MSDKRYGVVLTEQGAQVLAMFAEAFLTRAGAMVSLTAKIAEDEGNYLRVVLDPPGAAPVDLEVRLPHHFILAIVSAADPVQLKKLGFV
jgi:hypothetical protein